MRRERSLPWQRIGVVATVLAIATLGATLLKGGGSHTAATPTPASTTTTTAVSAPPATPATTAATAQPTALWAWNASEYGTAYYPPKATVKLQAWGFTGCRVFGGARFTVRPPGRDTVALLTLPRSVVWTDGQSAYASFTLGDAAGTYSATASCDGFPTATTTFEVQTTQGSSVVSDRTTYAPGALVHLFASGFDRCTYHGAVHFVIQPPRGAAPQVRSTDAWSPQVWFRLGRATGRYTVVVRCSPGEGIADATTTFVVTADERSP